jgi:hypothetical protein
VENVRLFLLARTLLSLKIVHVTDVVDAETVMPRCTGEKKTRPGMNIVDFRYRQLVFFALQTWTSPILGVGAIYTSSQVEEPLSRLLLIVLCLGVFLYVVFSGRGFCTECRHAREMHLYLSPKKYQGCLDSLDGCLCACQKIQNI